MTMTIISDNSESLKLIAFEPKDEYTERSELLRKKVLESNKCKKLANWICQFYVRNSFHMSILGHRTCNTTPSVTGSKVCDQ